MPYVGIPEHLLHLAPEALHGRNLDEYVRILRAAALRDAVRAIGRLGRRGLGLR